MERAFIVSINTGRIEGLAHGSRLFRTGIRKRPAEGPVTVGRLGLVGDAIGDKRHHGGEDQALYAYSDDDYDWWRASTGREFQPGEFGENLTLRGLPGDLAVGDRLLIGDVVLEATAPRIPCDTLSAHMGDPGFGMAFRRAERPGSYFRVLNEGEIRAGDAVTLVPSDGPAVTMLELFRFKYALRHDAATLRRFLDAPLAERFRADVERALAKAEATSA